MFEADGNEGGNGKDDSQDLVGDTARPDCEPHCEADERIAQDAAGEGLREGKPGLGMSDADRRLADRSTAQARDVAPHDQQNRSQAPDDVANVRQHPASQHLASADQSAGPRHRDEIVASEQLRTSHHDEDQSKAEGQAAQQACYAVAQSGVGHHHDKEQRPNCNEGAGQNGQNEEGQRVRMRLRNAQPLDLARDLKRRVSATLVLLVVHQDWPSDDQAGPRFNRKRRSGSQ